jgi:hypothetical protein
MTVEYRAAVLHAVGAPMTVEPVRARALGRGDLLVRITRQSSWIRSLVMF